MKKKIDDYGSLIQILKDEKISEAKAIKLISNKSKSGRPPILVKTVIYLDIKEIMKRSRLTRKSAIRNYLKSDKFKLLSDFEAKDKKSKLMGKSISRLEQIYDEVEKNPILVKGLGSLNKSFKKNA